MNTKYIIKIQNNTGYNIFTDWTSYLQIPFNLREASDATYDSASVILKLTDRKETFKPGTSVLLLLEDDPFYMIIDSDTVHTEYIGLTPKYTHEITLIERTKLTDDIIVPNISVTNPATISTSQEFSYIKESLFEDNMGTVDDGEDRWAPVNAIRFGFKSDFKRFMKTPVSESGYKTYLRSYTKEHNIFNIFNFSYSNKNISTFTFKNLYKTGESIEIKKPDITESQYRLDWLSGRDAGAITFSAAITRYFLGGINLRISSDGGATWKNVLYYGKTGYSITDEGSITSAGSDYVHIYPEFTGYVRNYSTSFTLILPNPGKYIIKMDKVPFIDHSPLDSDMDNNPEWILKSIATRWLPIGEWLTDTETCIHEFIKSIDSKADHKEPFKSEGDGDTFPIRTIDQLFNHAKDSYSVEITVGNEIPDDNNEGYRYKKIKDIVEKIIAIIPPSLGSFYLEYSPLLETVVPESKYIGKSMSEILFELGTLCNAYPYLEDSQGRVMDDGNVYDNILSFREVVHSDSIGNRNLENEIFSDEFSSRATSYRTDITNMVSFPDGQKLNYMYYPNSSSFGYMNGRAGASSISPDAGGITLYNSSGIYKLIHFHVQLNRDVTIDDVIVGKEQTIDITEYIHEKTFYDTLYNNSSFKTGLHPNLYKENAIYWTKGSNYINLGDIPEGDRINIFGDSVAPETYQLQNAIINKLAIDISKSVGTVRNAIKTIPSTSFKFQVCYIPIFSGDIRTERFNVSNNDRNIEYNFNQTSNNITEDFNDMAQIDILRRGNIDFSKTVYSKSYSASPKLGEILIQDGKYYFADNITYSIDNNTCVANINYTNDYSKINKNVAISKDYRQFEIYANDLIDRTIHKDFYMYITRRMTYMTSASGYAVLDWRDSDSLRYNPNFCQQLRQNKKSLPMYALIYFKDKNKNPLQYTEYMNDGDVKVDVGPILAPLTYMTQGNSLIFNTRFADNYAVRYEKGDSYTAYKNAWGNIFSGSIDDNNLASTIKDIRYVDDLGEAYYASVYILNNDEGLTLIDPETLTVTATEEELLSSGNENGSNNSKIFICSKDIPIMKDNKEVLSFTFQIHIISEEPDIKWHPALCKYMLNCSEDYDLIFKDSITNESKEEYLPVYVGTSRALQHELVLNYNAEDVIHIPDVNSNKDYIEGIPSANRDFSKYKSIALVYPKTREILFHIDLTDKDENGKKSIPTIYFKLLTSKLNNLK